MAEMNESDPILGRNVHRRNAYSENVKFDLDSMDDAQTTNDLNGLNRQSTVDQKACQLQVDEEVSLLMSSSKWLRTFGLKQNRLDLNHVLPSIGFKHCDEYNRKLRRPVSSLYGKGLFSQAVRSDGKTFNVICSKSKLKNLDTRLAQAILLYKRRLEWLTTGSRRIFSVICERSVIIVLSLGKISQDGFTQFRHAVERVIKEQVANIRKFNIIRAAEDTEMYSENLVPVSHDTVDGAVQWLWQLNNLDTVSKTSTCEAVLKAMADSQVESVCLYSVGDSVIGSQQLLKEKLSAWKGKRIPLHVVSYNGQNNVVIQCLKELADITGASFHSFSENPETVEIVPYQTRDDRSRSRRSQKNNETADDEEDISSSPDITINDDVMLIFEELEEANNALAQIKSLIDSVPEPKYASSSHDLPDKQYIGGNPDQYMSSKDWLLQYGLEACKLGLYQILSGVAFKHRDGVIGLNQKPPNEYTQTDAICHPKLVNARYCDRFPVLPWKDGQAVHVQVTPDVHRLYQDKMAIALNRINQRIEWLKQGSRELFGTMLEDHIHLLIDTSSSMVQHIHFVKEKIFILMQEQLRHKKKVNFITFNTKSNAWCERLMDVSEGSLKNAWEWIQALLCEGSTNTYSAIQLAMADKEAQAIYLLTDGRPDQPPNSILAQVQMENRIPIHTISFNCNDMEANKFLHELAKVTGGRYHYFNETGQDVEVPVAWESEDIQLLKQEHYRGVKNLDQMCRLREECAALAWQKDNDSDGSRTNRSDGSRSFRSQLESKNNSPRDSPRSAIKNLNSSRIPHPPAFSSSPRPHSAPPQERVVRLSSPLPNRPATASGRPQSSKRITAVMSHRSDQPLSSRSFSQLSSSSSGFHEFSRSRSPDGRFHMARVAKKPLLASHTRTSLLRTLNSTGTFRKDSWLLPETQALFDRQSDRQISLEKASFEASVNTKRKTRRNKESRAIDNNTWMKKNSLRSQRLTILDALAPAMVVQKAKYVPVLDKHIVSKVFDDILPLAHVSGKNRNQIRLINPYGVDLKGYERKLDEAIQKFKGQLDKLANGTEKRDHSLESELIELEGQTPRSNKENLERDITLLEQEIARAERYQNLSQELRKAADGPVLRKTRKRAKKKNNNNSTNVSIDDDSVLEEVITENCVTAEQQQGSLLSSILEHNHSSQSEIIPSGILHSTVESPEVHATSMATKKNMGKKKTKKNVRIALDGWRGQRVIARSDEDGMYYPGHVIKCTSASKAQVKFDQQNKLESVETHSMLPSSGATSRPIIMVGDYVFVQVVNLESNRVCHVPGIVQVIPMTPTDQAKFYTIILYNQKRLTAQRSHLYKIGSSRFESTTADIQRKQKQKDNEAAELSKLVSWYMKRYPPKRPGTRQSRSQTKTSTSSKPSRHKQGTEDSKRSPSSESSFSSDDSKSPRSASYRSISGSHTSRSRSLSTGSSYSRSTSETSVSKSRLQSNNRSRSRSEDERARLKSKRKMPSKLGTKSRLQSNNRSRSEDERVRLKSNQKLLSKSDSSSHQRSKSRSQSPSSRSWSRSDYSRSSLSSESCKEISDEECHSELSSSHTDSGGRSRSSNLKATSTSLTHDSVDSFITSDDNKNKENISVSNRNKETANHPIKHDRRSKKRTKITPRLGGNGRSKLSPHLGQATQDGNQRNQEQATQCSDQEESVDHTEREPAEQHADQEHAKQRRTEELAIHSSKEEDDVYSNQFQAVKDDDNSNQEPTSCAENHITQEQADQTEIHDDHKPVVQEGSLSNREQEHGEEQITLDTPMPHSNNEDSIQLEEMIDDSNQGKHEHVQHSKQEEEEVIEDKEAETAKLVTPRRKQAVRIAKVKQPMIQEEHNDESSSNQDQVAVLQSVGVSGQYMVKFASSLESNVKSAQLLNSAHSQPQYIGSHGGDLICVPEERHETAGKNDNKCVIALHDSKRPDFYTEDHHITLRDNSNEDAAFFKLKFARILSD